MVHSMLLRSGCLRVTRVLQSYLDGEVDAATSAIVAQHLEECRRCGLEASTYRTIKSAITQVGHDAAPVDPAAVERLRSFAHDLAEPRH
ncbi:MAG: anti-sigma factor family protein [Cellulomonas sp.]